MTSREACSAAIDRGVMSKLQRAFGFAPLSSNHLVNSKSERATLNLVGYVRLNQLDRVDLRKRWRIAGSQWLINIITVIEKESEDGARLLLHSLLKLVLSWLDILVQEVDNCMDVFLLDCGFHRSRGHCRAPVKHCAH